MSTYYRTKNRTSIVGRYTYTGAAFVGWSRVESDNHYWEDVIAGAAIGIASIYLFMRPWESGVSVGVYYERGSAGLALSIHW